MASPARKADGGLRVSVRVTPKSGRDQIAGASRDEAGYRLLVKVTAPPADGEANAAVVAVVARAFGVAKSCVTILRGDTGREKLLLIEGDADRLSARFAELERKSS